jgi:LPS-assembly protein
MPRIGNSSSKGTVLGDSFYWAINRSMDAEIGAEYFSRRGWAQRGDFRARPSDSSYLNLTYFGVIDRGIGTPKVRQGGEEVRLNAVDLIGHNFRAVTDVDYLSSFVFRVAFIDAFNQAVNSEVRSQAFLSNTTRGFSYNAFAQRYQNFQSTNNVDVITILHAPSFDFSSVVRELGKFHFSWTFETAAEGLYRSEPSFRTPRLVGRFDVNPSLSLPLLFGGWSLRPEVGIRDTLYTEQLVPSSSRGLASSDPINRKALETSVELRPPVLERIFDHEFLGRKLKHVIEPRVVYRRVMGVDNFSKILRFDEGDILSDTNEVEYGVVSRLFAKRRPSATENCSTTGLPSPNQPSPSQTISPPWEQPDTQPSTTSNCPVGPPARELVSWELAQKYFLDTNFGGALVNGSRNVFTTTADFTAIAFLTSPRHLSPLISRLRIQPGSNVDAEWDLDYDFTSGRVNASTAVLNYHIGQISFGGGDAYLRIPGEVLVSNTTAGAASFHQLRMQLGYGHSNKRGLSGAAALGFDANLGLLQYSAVQTTYNWDCCGITVEYRRFSLGTVRNDNQYFFTYSLANIGSFGNLMRKERLY